MQDSLLIHLLDTLAPLGVRASRMFGGYGVYRGDAFFAIVFEGRIYFRTDERTVAAYQAAGSQPFHPGPRHTLGSYWEVPAEVLDDPETLQVWARLAADRPIAKPLKKKKKTPPRPPAGR